MAIPKLIHQTFSEYDLLPPPFIDNIRSIKEMNPNWTYKFYNDRSALSFVKTHYNTQIVDLYLSINPKYGAARADFFRYLVIYKIGGIYIDIKSGLDLPLDEAMCSRDVYLLSHWNNRIGQRFENYGIHPGCGERGEFQQWHIVAAPRHPFLRAVIEAVMRNIASYDVATSGVGFKGVWNVTGPVAYTKAILPLLQIYFHTLLDIETIGFRYSISDTHRSDLPGQYYKMQLEEPIVL